MLLWGLWAFLLQSPQNIPQLSSRDKNSTSTMASWHWIDGRSCICQTGTGSLKKSHFLTCWKKRTWSLQFYTVYNLWENIQYNHLKNMFTYLLGPPFLSNVRLMDYYCSQRTHRSMKFTTKILPTIYIYIKSILCKKYVPRVNTYLQISQLWLFKELAICLLR